VLAVGPAFSGATLADYIAQARAKPGEMTYGSGGNGTLNHLIGQLLARSAGVTLTHVPYRGSAPAMTDTMGGQIPSLMESTPTVLGNLRAGRLRALAIGSTARLSVLPEVPTLTEALGKPMTAEAWFGLLAPRGTAEGIVARIGADVATLAADPAQRARMEATGAEIAATTPAAFATMIRDEGARWAPIVRASGAQVD